MLGLAAAQAQDEVELLSGTRVRGRIIERTDQTIRIEVPAENRQLIRSFPLNRVRAVTQNGQRHVLAPGAEGASKADSPGESAAPSLAGSSAAIISVIEQTGRTPPDWFESTPLEYPDTLDLSWPEPAPVIWNYTRNVDHYIWDIINTNARRYRGGVRLMHHLLVVNQKNESTRARVMNELGRMYFEFFRDYARAAFWWRQAKVDQNPQFSQTPNAARLAECYWRLGDRALAVDTLQRLPLTAGVIKAWGDLKDIQTALRLCEEGLKRGLPASQVYLLAGDACRAAREFTKAAEYYGKVAEVSVQGSPVQIEQIKRDQDRAAATMEVIRLFDTLDVGRIPDGTYSGKTLGYSGILEVEAVVKARRIESINVTYNPDRQYFHAVEETIRRILAKQTVNGVDAISGATVTSEAVIRASAKALAEGMKAHAVAP